MRAGSGGVRGVEGQRAEHVAYALFRDGAEFVHLFVSLTADDSAAVAELPSFKTYAKYVGERSVAPPEPIG